MVLYGSYLETNILKMYQLLQIDCLKALCLFRMKRSMFWIWNIWCLDFWVERDLNPFIIL